VWSTQSDRREGTLRLDAGDVSKISASFLRNAHLDVLNASSNDKSSFVLEKFPEHAFKIPALLRIFPDAKFIHIIRDPHDVASSIGSFEAHTWFGATGRKWNEICKIATEQLKIISRDVLMRDVKDNLALRGLIEWAVAMYTIENDVTSVWPSKDTKTKHFLELKYEDLVSDPVRTVRIASRFITEQKDYCDKDLELFASSSIKKSSEKKKRRKDILNFIQSNKFIKDMASRKGY
jgi:hypothetical protein